MDKGTLRLVIFSFITSLLFPVFAFAFTTITGEQVQTYDIVLDENALIDAGISLTDAESHNITFDQNVGLDYDVYQEYYVGNQSVRIRWVRGPNGDRFQVIRQGWVDRQLGQWFFVTQLDMKLGADIFRHTPTRWGGIENDTIVQYFGVDGYNWTMFKLPQNGLTGFITTYPADLNNITYAVYERGNVTCTLGSTVTEYQDWNFRQFVGWYWTLFVGSNEWGLPIFMAWMVRIMQGLSVISGILLLKELTRI